MENWNAYGSVLSSLEFYQNNRKTLSDLYESEKYFLEPIFKKVNSVLDIGCAAGGVCQICYKVNQSLSYTGIDISPEFISLAKKHYPNSSFEYYDGYTIPYSKSNFDLVYSIGVLHHLPHWKDIIKQMLLISKEYVVFDLRLTKEKTLNNPNKYFQKITFNEVWDDKTKISYIVLNIDEVYQFIKSIIKDNYSCEVFGYASPPTSLSTIPYSEIYMCSFCITKNKSTKDFIDNVRW